MRRPGAILAIVVLLALGAWAATRLFVSDETRITWLFEGAAASFHDASLGGCTEIFDARWRDGQIDKATLRAALFVFFRNERDGKTKRFPHRVRIPEASRTIQITADGKATAELEVVFETQEEAGGDWREQWVVRTRAQLEKGDSGWLVHRSTHETIRGNRPR